MGTTPIMKDTLVSTSGGPLDFHRSVGFRVNSYLVDSASSHMLVSKIKPCMSKYKHFIL